MTYPVDPDDYSTPGKTLGEMHGLTDDDPYSRFPQEKAKEEIKEKLTKDLTDIFKEVLEKNGIKLPEKSEEEDVFVDPENDEDLTIEAESASVFWKIVFPDTRLIDVITLEPTLKKLALTGKNNAAGCWFAFTSKKIAERIAKQIDIQNEVYRCNAAGEKNGKSQIKVVVEDWRPWKPTGNKTDEPYKAEEFQYCMKIINGKVFVYFVPESWWNENQKIYNKSLNIAMLVKETLTRVNHYCFQSLQNELATQGWLDSHGFRENLLFNMYINEMDL